MKCKCDSLHVLRLLFVCVLIWPVVTSVLGFSGLSWFQPESSTEVQAGTVFSVYTHCPIIRQHLSLCTVAARLTPPLTVLKDRKKTSYQVHSKPVVMAEKTACIWWDTHWQVITGARAGGAAATEHCARNLRAGWHCKHTVTGCNTEPASNTKHTASFGFHTLQSYLDSGWCCRLGPRFPAPHSSFPPPLDWDCHTLSSGFERPHHTTWYTVSSYSTDPSHHHLDGQKLGSVANQIFIYYIQVWRLTNN